MQLFDGLGQVVLNQPVSLAQGSNYVPLHELELLPSSLYVAAVQFNNQRVVTKLIAR